MDAKGFYKEYGAGTITAEYGYCVDGKIISIKEIIEISERKCSSTNKDVHCRTCTLRGEFP